MDLIEGCCGLASPFIIIYIIYQIIATTKANKEYERKKAQEKAAEQRRLEEARKREEAEQERQKQERLSYLRREIDRKSKQVSDGTSDIHKEIRNFLMKEYSPTTILHGKYYAVKDTTYYGMSNDLSYKLKSLQPYISDMRETNNTLIREFPSENRNDEIINAETKLSQAEKALADFKAFYQRVGMLPSSKMMNEKSYGKNNSVYWDVIHGMDRDDAVKYISTCEQYIAYGQVDRIYAIDIEQLLRCVWFFATEKPFSASDFQKARSVFNRIYKQSHADIIIADLYAKKCMGGEDTIREHVRNIPDALLSSHIASSLMWMNAYQAELMVLQHMLSTGKEMNAKMQERLHSLTNGGGKVPSGFDVKSSGSEFYFDVSALAWRDDEYVGLFENLAFQDKNLTYSLAIRDENKELFIPQGINVPSNDLVLKKFSSVFTEEYGNSVTVRSANCVALSGSGEEKIDGILVSSNECNQMGILIHIARIGKKLIIKFYTLFIPTGSDLAAQKQQALSIYKKLSPSVTMWESSLKDTMLMAVEQILNSNVQGGGTTNTDPNGRNSNEPIF